MGSFRAPWQKRRALLAAFLSENLINAVVRESASRSCVNGHEYKMKARETDNGITMSAAMNCDSDAEPGKDS